MLNGANWCAQGRLGAIRCGFDEKSDRFMYHWRMSAQLSMESMTTAVHAALNAWSQMASTSQELLDHLLLVQQRRTEMAVQLPVTLRLATNDVLHACLEELALHDPASANILTWRYLDGETIQAVANRSHLGRDQLMRRQRKAIKALAQIILEKEMVAREERAQLLESMLIPPSYNALFGVEKPLQELVDLLLAGPPWLVSVTGMGGIGKSSLANASVRQIIRHFYYDRIVWLSVPSAPSESSSAHFAYDDLMTQLAAEVCPHLSPQSVPHERDLAVQQVLKSSPHLVVIDNLEVALDSGLLIHLHNLADPSKFLLTNRVRQSSQIGVFNFPIQELSVNDAIALIRYQAKTIGNSDLANADEDILQRIHHLVGGNPLALKLVVGLNYDISLPQIMTELVQVKIQAIESLYRHIYWRVWKTLSSEAKQLLEVMPMSSDTGIVQAQMQAISGLEEKQLLQSIQELSKRSLLEVRGTPTERRYTIHGLTRTFLGSEIIKWPTEAI